MTKKQFLEELEKLLFALNEEEKFEIIYFYRERIENGVYEGKTEDEVIKSLEAPKVIAKNIYNEYGINYEAFTDKSEPDLLIDKGHKKLIIKDGRVEIHKNGKKTVYNDKSMKGSKLQRRRKADKVHELFMGAYTLSVITLYLLLGFAFNLWHPGWLLFITIPLAATVIETIFDITTLPGVMVFASTIAFFLTGFYAHRWGLALVWFMTIPLSGAIVGPLADHKEREEDEEYFTQTIVSDEVLDEMVKKHEQEVKEEKKAQEQQVNETSVGRVVGIIFFDLIVAISLIGGLFGFAMGMFATLMSTFVVPVWVGINANFLSNTEVMAFIALWIFGFIFSIFITLLAIELFIWVTKWIVIFNIKMFGYRDIILINKIKKLTLIRRTRMTRFGPVRRFRKTFKFSAVLSVIGLVLPAIFIPTLLLGDTFVNRTINDTYLHNVEHALPQEVESINVSYINGKVKVVETNETEIKMVHYYDFEVRNTLTTSCTDVIPATCNVLNKDNDGFVKYLQGQARREKLVIYVPKGRVIEINIDKKTTWNWTTEFPFN